MWIPHQFRYLVENGAFDVCRRLGEKLHISTEKVRLYFIYLSFLTFGSPVIIYFFIGFWLNIRNYFRKKNHPVMD